MRRRTIILGALILLAVIIAWPVLLHFRLKHRVAKYRQQLIAQGEKMTVAELTPLLPADRDNGAADFLAAVWRVGIINSTNQPPAMKRVVPGRAVVVWQQPVLPTWKTTNAWPGLREDFEVKSDALAAMRDAIKSPALVFPLDYAQGFSINLAHVADLKRAAQWFSAGTVLELHEGRATNAADNLQAMLALVSNYKDEPLMISSLVRFAIAAIAITATWEALQSPNVMDEQLAQLQTGWESVDFLTPAEAALSMERVMAGHTIAEMRTSPQSAMATFNPMGGTATSGLAELMELGQGVLQDPAKGMKELFRRYPGYWAWKWWWSYADELAQMKFQQADLVAVREARTERSFGPALARCDQTMAAIRKQHPKAGAWIDYDLGSTFQHFVTRLRDVETQRELLVAAIAIRRFQLRHGVYPDSLTALVPEFCREVPRDPVDGQPLRYRPQPDSSFLLYSVGENGTDDGGNPLPPETETPRWQWLKGRDVVWPQPASAQATLIFELEEEGNRDKQQIRSRVVVTNGLSPDVIEELERLAQSYHFTLTNNAVRQP